MIVCFILIESKKDGTGESNRHALLHSWAGRDLYAGSIDMPAYFSGIWIFLTFNSFTAAIYLFLLVKCNVCCCNILCFSAIIVWERYHFIHLNFDTFTDNKLYVFVPIKCNAGASWMLKFLSSAHFSFCDIQWFHSLSM